MKKLLIGLLLATSALIFTSCNDDEINMDYKYSYFTEEINSQVMPEGIETPEEGVIELPTINVDLRVVDELGPNIYVVETHFYNEAGDDFDVNAISLVVDYNSDDVEFLESVTINDVLYINEYENIDSLGITLYKNTGNDLRYAFATIIENKVSDEFIFREVIKILSESTQLEFSKVPGEAEFADFNSNIYPLVIQNIKFEKIK